MILYIYHLDIALISCRPPGAMLTSTRFNLKVNPYSKYHVVYLMLQSLVFYEKLNEKKGLGDESKLTQL